MGSNDPSPHKANLNFFPHVISIGKNTQNNARKGAKYVSRGISRKELIQKEIKIIDSYGQSEPI